FPDHQRLKPDDHTLFFMAEDSGLCTHYRYHKHKLVLFLSAMRNHSDELSKKYRLEYHQLNAQNSNKSYEQKLSETLDKFSSIEKIITYDIEDAFMDKRIRDFCKENKLELEVVESPAFITTQKEFRQYLEKHPKPFMHTFYKEQRKRLGILLNSSGDPLHGKWSFDSENRKKLPKNIRIPEQPESALNDNDKDVIKLVNQLFEDHLGNTDSFQWSTTRRSVLYRLDHFLKENFEDFGPYEDAIDKDRVFLFHSVLSPYLNMGLITPDELTDRVMEYYDKNNTHYSSVEGFVRQLIGWREFMRGIYHHFDLEKNHFHHQRKMKDCWYNGTTGIPPLDDSIKKALKYGYTHHIERLMVLGNLMLTTGLHPQEVYGWFMEMYVDSADWVMAPNVYGMSQFAEGGIFATKPYIGGSNYILKMSNYKKGDWCDIVDGLYWRFIDAKKKTFAGNQRMSMMVRSLEKMDSGRKKRIFKAADEWTEQVSYV
ncbi:MAG: cryptochrome/photolyase family protein, partial [Owenweeksia sp.]